MGTNSLFAKLVNVFAPMEVQHSFFGRLVYMDIGSKKTSYWEARRTFQSSAQKTELFIDAPAPKTAPNEAQKQFYLDVELRYPKIINAAESLLRKNYQDWFERPLTTPLETAFILTSFSIPLITLEQADWEITFEVIDDAEHLFTVSFHGLTALSVAIDG